MSGLEQWIVQVRRGVVELLVLRVLRRRGEMHGYALVKELMALGPFISGESTVYPILRRLASDGLLSSHWVQVPEAPPRKYYELSDAGVTFLEQADGEWEALVDAMRKMEKESRS